MIYECGERKINLSDWFELKFVEFDVVIDFGQPPTFDAIGGGSIKINFKVDTANRTDICYVLVCKNLTKVLVAMCKTAKQE